MVLISVRVELPTAKLKRQISSMIVVSEIPADIHEQIILRSCRLPGSVGFQKFISRIFPTGPSLELSVYRLTD